MKKQQQKSNNKIFLEADDQQNNNINLLDEPLTIALVLRGSAEAIQELKSFLSKSELKLIYKTVSYGHLYITTKKEEEHE